MSEGEYLEGERPRFGNKLDPRNPIDAGIMIVERMRTAWGLDTRTPDGQRRLDRIRVEIDYLTASKGELEGGSAIAPISAAVKIDENGRVTSHPLFAYDAKDVAHRVAHPDRPGDDERSVDPDIRKEVEELLAADPNAIKNLASIDMLLTG